MTLSAHRISTEDRRENIDRMIYQIENLEQEKVKANLNYDRAQYNLLLLIEGYELPSRKEILDALGSLDKWSESAIEILSTFSDLYFKGSQLEKGYMIVEEMVRLEKDYSKASEIAWDYLNLLRSSNSPGLSQRTKMTGTSLTAGMVTQCNDIRSCTQTGLSANIEQNKQQYRDVSIKSGLIEISHIHNPVLFNCNRQSDTTVQISSMLSRTESKLSGNIEADVIMTCKAVDITSSGTEGNRRKYQRSSAFNASTSLMSHQNDVRRSAEYAEAVLLAISRIVRKTDNYNIYQFKSSKWTKSTEMFKSRKKFTFTKCSKFRKRPKSLNPYKSRKRPKSRKTPKCRKSKFSMSSKPKKRFKSRMNCKSRKRFRSKKTAKSKIRCMSYIWSKPKKRSNWISFKLWELPRSRRRCMSLKRSKSKKRPKSRNRSKSKKGSVQREEDEESGSWVKCTSRSYRVPVRTSYIDGIEKLSPVRNSLLFHKNDF